MAEFVNVSFVGSAGTALSTHDANWIKHTSYSTGNVILSDANRARRNTNNTSMYWYDATPPSADYKARAPLFAKETDGGASNTGVCGRVDTAANTMYHARYGGGTTDGWQLYKFVAGVVTQLGSTSSQSLTDETSNEVELWMQGTSIELYKQGSGTPTISVTDSAISAAGYAGIRFVGTTESDTTGLHIDGPFIAEDFSSSGPDGTAAITLAGDTIAASASPVASSSAAITLAGDTLSAAATPVGDSSAAFTLAGDVIAASGDTGNTISSSAAITLLGDIIAASASLEYPSSAAITLNGDTIAASGTVTILTTAAITLSGVGMSASGTSGDTTFTFPPCAIYLGGNIALGTNGQPIVLIFV